MCYRWVCFNKLFSLNLWLKWVHVELFSFGFSFSVLPVPFSSWINFERGGVMGLSQFVFECNRNEWRASVTERAKQISVEVDSWSRWRPENGEIHSNRSTPLIWPETVRHLLTFETLATQQVAIIQVVNRFFLRALVWNSDSIFFCQCSDLTVWVAFINISALIHIDMIIDAVDFVILLT